jgi:hypothetical protein
MITLGICKATLTNLAATQTIKNSSMETSY